MATKIPSEMRALVLEQYREDAHDAIDRLQLATRPVAMPGRGQVLVKIEAAPCNPSDLLLLVGKYGTLKKLPTVPGWEGTGTVVKSGGGLLARLLSGKRVACGLQGDRDGTWAEYFLADADNCVPLKNELPIEQAASLVINPMTAVGLLDTARRDGHRAAVHTAGASQVGRMLIALARKAGFPLIPVVRRQEQVELLRSVGAKDTLNSSDADFADQLRDLCAKRKATAAFEAIAGDMTGIIAGALPPDSSIYLYGALSETACGNIDPIDVIFRNKTLRGFYLGHWVQQQGLIRLFRLGRHVQQMLIDGAIASDVQRKVPLEQAQAGLRRYLDHMTDGKVLITPGMEAEQE